MSKTKLAPLHSLPESMTLYRDNETGIAWIEDGASGCGYSLHPNIDASGSVSGMKKRGYWHKDARCIRAHGYIYNIDSYVPESDRIVNAVLKDACHCGGYHGR